MNVGPHEPLHLNDRYRGSFMLLPTGSSWAVLRQMVLSTRSGRLRIPEADIQIAGSGRPPNATAQVDLGADASSGAVWNGVSQQIYGLPLRCNSMVASGFRIGLRTIYSVC